MNILTLIMGILLLASMGIILLLVKRTGKPIGTMAAPSSTTGEVVEANSAPVLSEPAPIPKQLVLKSTDPNLKDLLFEKTTIPQLQKRNAKIQQVDLGNPLSALPTVAVDAVAGLGAANLFRATVDPSTLTKFADGTVSTMVHGSGGIIKNAGFQAVAAAQVFAPILVFQVASILTGQYYLHGISKQLSAISEKLQQLINLHHFEKSAILSSHYEVLMRKSDQTHFTPEDLNELLSIYRDANSIRHEYCSLLDNVDTHDYTAAIKGLSAKKWIDQLRQKVIDDGTQCYSEMIVCAERTRIAAKMLELKCNISLCKGDHQRIYGVIDSMSDLAEIRDSLQEPEWVQLASEKYNDALRVAQIIRNKANLKSSLEKALLAEHEYTSLNAQCESEQKRLHKEVLGTVKALDTELNKPRELLLSLDENGDIKCSQLLLSA
jgi:hypothetical protein